jgi:type I restriction enzyme S subunit
MSILQIQLPEGWKINKLKDILELKYGAALKKADRRPGSVPVFGSAGIIGNHDTKLATGPGIIVGRKGNVGSVFWSDCDFYVIDTAYFVKSNLPLRFLFYLLPTLNFINSDSAVPGLSRSQAYSLDVILPPLATQERIAGILSAYDELIEISQRRIQLLESMARSLYREWFVDFRFPDHEKNTLVSSTFGQIPYGWEIRKVNEFADFERGVEPGSDAYVTEIEPGFVKFLRVGDFSKRSGNLFVSEQLTKGKRLNPKDIAVTLDGSVGLVRVGLSGAYSTGIRKINVRNKARLGWSFVYNLMLSGHIQATIEAHAKGTTIKHAGTAVAALEFVSPPEQLINLFEKITSPMLMQILNLNDQLNNLYQTRDLLLPRLLSGQIDLSNQLDPMTT